MTAAASSNPTSSRISSPTVATRKSDILGWALPLYLLLICGGFAFLRSPQATAHGSELSVDRAAFTSMNAATCTGFSQSIALDGLRPLGRAGIVILIAGGGLLTLSIGGTLVSIGAGLGYTERTIVVTSASMLVAAALLGSATLSDTALHGAMQGIGAISNCGLLVAGTLGGVGKLSTWTVLLPLSVIGGLGAPVVLDVGRRVFSGRALSKHSLAVMLWSAMVYLAGTVVLRCLFTASATAASAMALNSRSAGFDLVPLGSFTQSGFWMIMALMVIGSSPGGSGGGLKVTLPIVLWRGFVQCYRGKVPQRSFAVSLAWTAGFLLLVFVGTIVLVGLQPQVPGDRMLFVAVSAATNVGLSGDPITMVGTPLFVLGALAVLGRAVPFLILWWWSRGVASESDGIAVG